MAFLKRYESTIYGPYRRAGIVAGLWAGLLLALYLVVRWLAGSPLSAPQGYGGDIILLLAMLFFSVRYRRRLPQEKVTLKELMQLNMWTGFVSALLLGVSLWLYGTALDHDFLRRCVDVMVEAEQQSGRAVEEQAQAVAVMRAYTLPTLAWIGAFRAFVMSILWAFLVALLLRTERAPARAWRKKEGRVPKA